MSEGFAASNFYIPKAVKCKHMIVTCTWLAEDLEDSLWSSEGPCD